MRVYLPTTLPRLAAALDAGQFDIGTGYAVTPALREWYVEGDLEELEYVATAAAARASLRLVSDDLALAELAGGAVPARRVVVAADVPDAMARPGHDLPRAALRLSVPVPVAQVVSAHVDDARAADDVRRAVDALDAAEGGDEDAQFLVDAVEDHELGWYAAQELGVLVELET
jgi:hypothetical protein